MRIVLVDDDNVIRQALAAALGVSGLDVVGEARDPAAALAVVDDTAPDVVLVDLQLVDGRPAGGLELAEALHERNPDVALLVLSNFSFTAYLERLIALAEGGRGLGYVLKGGAGGLDDLVDAIRRVERGEVYVDPLLVRELMQSKRTKEDPISMLTPTELLVLELMARGRSNVKIAQELGVKVSTAERHITNIFAKLRLGAATDGHHRSFNARVMAVLAYLRHVRTREPGPDV